MLNCSETQATFAFTTQFQDKETFAKYASYTNSGMFHIFYTKLCMIDQPS